MKIKYDLNEELDINSKDISRFYINVPRKLDYYYNKQFEVKYLDTQSYTLIIGRSVFNWQFFRGRRIIK